MKDIPWVLIVVGLLVGSYFAVPQVQTFVNGIFTKAPAPTTQGVVTTGGQVCVYDGATMTIGPMSDRWSPGTSVTNRGARVFVNGVDRGVKADGATLAVNYGDQVEIFYAENDSATGYYTGKSTFTVPCTSAFSSADRDDAEKIIPTESLANNLSLSFFNTNNGNLNADGDSQTINAGDVKTMKFEFQPTYQDGYAPYCNAVVVAEGNLTAYDRLEFVGWEAASIPSQHVLGATTSKGWAYKMPQLALPSAGSYPIQSGSFLIDAAAVDTAGSNNITLSFYDCDWFQNSKSGVMQQGVEDDNNADVGRAIVRKVIAIQ